MAEDSIVFPDLSLIDRVRELLTALELPSAAEFRVEPALDYPGQQVAIDIAAPTIATLSSAIEVIRDALFHEFRIATRTASEFDRETLLRQTA